MNEYIKEPQVIFTCDFESYKYNKLSKEEQQKKIESTWERIVVTLKDKPVNMTYDKEKFLIKFEHSSDELISIINKYSLNKIINGYVYLMPQMLMTMNYNSLQVNLSSEDYKKIEPLVKKGEKFLSSKVLKQIQISKELSDLTGNDPVKLITKLFEKYEGLCFGECHSDKAPKMLIINNLKTLKQCGVTTIYFEHVPYDTMKKLFDSYTNSDSDEMPGYLKEYLDRLSNGQRLGNEHNYSYTNLVKESKKAGIQVIPIDTSVSYYAGSNIKTGVDDPKNRYIAMNSVSAAIISHEQKNKSAGKYIALIGNGHLSTGNVSKVPGLAEVLQVPSINIKSGETTKIEYNKTDFHEDVPFLSANITLEMNKTKFMD